MGSEAPSSEGHWVSIADAASELGVSVDTVRRRMKRQELPAKREQRAQGFRWLVRLDGEPPSVGDVPDAGAGEDSGRPATPSLQAAILSEHDELVRELRDRLTGRDREASELRAIIARQAAAIEQQARQLTATVASRSPETAAVSEDGAGERVPARPTAAALGAQEPSVDQRPWWRRWFGSS